MSEHRTASDVTTFTKTSLDLRVCDMSISTGQLVIWRLKKTAIRIDGWSTCKDRQLLKSELIFVANIVWWLTLETECYPSNATSDSKIAAVVLLFNIACAQSCAARNSGCLADPFGAKELFAFRKVKLSAAWLAAKSEVLQLLTGN